MDFLGISSLGIVYHYDIKIKKNIQERSKKEFAARYNSQHKKNKGEFNSPNKG
jgi:hypothetical protein